MPDVRRIEAGWGLSVTGELAGTVTLVAYSFAAGGVGLVAVYTAARTLAGMGAALGLAGAPGRIRRDGLLRTLTALRAAFLALAALAVALHGPPLAVIALAAASSALAGTYRPVQTSLLPWLVRTPADLAAANVTATVLENSGALGGPALAGALLTAEPAWVPMACAAAFLGLAALSLRRLAAPRRPGQAGRGLGRAVRDVGTGLSELARLARPGGVTVLVFAQTFVRGALTVLIVVLAIKTLALGPSAVGWLNAAIGVGGMAGGALAARLVRVTRLGRSFVTGVLVWGLSLAVLAPAPSPALAYLALVAVGIGNAVEDVGIFTLVPRLVSPRVGGSVGAAKEFTALAGLGAGSVAAPWLLHGFGTRGTLALLGGGLAALALAHARRFAQIDRAMPVPGDEAELLRRLDIFAPLPLAVIELLATELTPRDFAPGTVVIREGEPGDQFHLITAGSALVSVHGKPRPALGRGDGFGEIALLRDVPRTATVVADQPLRTLALDQDMFLFAVTGNSASGAAADALVTRRLAADRGAGPGPAVR